MFSRSSGYIITNTSQHECFIIYVGFECNISVRLEALLPHAGIHTNKRLDNIVGLLGIPILAVLGNYYVTATISMHYYRFYLTTKRYTYVTHVPTNKGRFTPQQFVRPRILSIRKLSCQTMKLIHTQNGVYGVALTLTMVEIRQVQNKV
jgi:hypothetical protein